MGFSTFSGPIRSGTVRNTTGTTVGSLDNTGVAVLMQSAVVPFSSASSTVAVLPAGSQILNIFVDTTTLFNAATTVTFGNGTTADLYASSTTITTAARHDVSDNLAPAEVDNVGTTDVKVVATLTTTATAGSAVMTVVYAQKASNGAEVPASA
jgi:hypothetical protein